MLYLVEKDHHEVCFHAAQSILTALAVFAVDIPLTVLGVVPVIGLIAWLLTLVLGLASWRCGSTCSPGWNLHHARLPLVGPMAEQWAGR